MNIFLKILNMSSKNKNKILKRNTKQLYKSEESYLPLKSGNKHFWTIEIQAIQILREVPFLMYIY